MIQDRLWLEVERVADRYHRLRFWRALTIGWVIAAVVVLLLSAVGVVTSRDPSVFLPVLGSVATVLVVLCAWAVHASKPGPEWVARQIETEFPDLGSCLLAAIEQQPALADGRFGYLQESVIRQALVHAACHSWSQVVPTRRLAWAVAMQSATLALFVLALTNPPVGVARSLIASSPEGPQPVVSTSEFSVEVEPGTTEIEKGTSLLVLARITGQVPADATLVMQPAASEPTQLEMTRSLEDPVFGGRIATVMESLDYRVELGGQTTPTFRVTVFEYPRLERADARLVYPSYTGLEERVVQDVRTISVVEGTQVTLICKLNKPVKSARFMERSPVAKNSPVAPRQESRTATDAAPANDAQKTSDVDGESGIRLAERDGYYEATITASKSRRLKLELIDEAGRRNVEQADISINVVPNQPPTLKLVQPARDLEVSPLEELDVKATAWDDFGVKRMGVSFALAGKTAVDVLLGENAAAKQKHELANAIKFEELEAQPDQLLSYFFWAEDFGPDGNLRRTSSDMYFAEVRHFEEIFRQSQQPPGGQQQQKQQQQNSPAGQQAQQLAQSQKEIINATWKLIRREIGSKPTEPFAEDVEQLIQSQSALSEKAVALGEKLSDDESQAHLTAVLEAMQQATKQLTAAHDQPSAAPLPPALVAEQSAYQALLKLRAREHEVVRQQQQQSSGQQSQGESRSQQQRQQMQQLDLKNEENRYESQRQAQAQQETPKDRETRQVLNRLRELARRQNDLNERLKDLQSALQEAQTAERKEEIKQQLKRLQDEQKQVLRDTDELQSRMESPENQERMAEERQQLEQARDQVQRASEALEKEQVTQAAASGTRAEKEFEELRNEFRRRASNRFNEEMREMRDSARDLDQEQKKLSEQLTEVTKPDPSAKKSLRDDNRSEEIVKGLNEQKEKLSNLTERMKQTIEEAEQTEPLLTERLYDASRNVQDQKVDRALEAAGRWLQRGLIEDAQKVEQIAGRGINQLREGVEKAAEAVLGDETEALRRAREQLKNLSQELNREVARNSPEDGSQLPREKDGEMRRSGDGEAKNEPNPASESQPKESQKGERQPGQGQNGQQPNGQRPGEQQPREGQQPGQQRGGQQPSERQPNEAQHRRRPAKGQQPGERQPGQPQSNQPPRGQESGQQPGQQPGERQPGQSQPGQQSGQPGQQPQDGQPQPGQPQNGQRGQRGAPRLTDGNQSGGARQSEGGANREFAPISGEDFLNWSDRLRDVEEMVDDPELRAEAARIRDEARAIRAEMKRHSKEPNWNLVRVNVAQPLVELSNRVSDELLRRTSKQAMVPLDRDPVPPKYSKKTRRYYERLGSGK